MQTLANGTLVGLRRGAGDQRVRAGGSLLFDAHLPFDMSFYRAFRFPWSGRPLTPPALLASLNNTGEETIVHVSWNGATEVAAWRVLAGKGPASLQAQATIASSGFESSTILPSRYAYVAVQALSSARRVLGASKPARVLAYAASLATRGTGCPPGRSARRSAVLVSRSFRGLLMWARRRRARGAAPRRFARGARRFAAAARHRHGGRHGGQRR